MDLHGPHRIVNTISDATLQALGLVATADPKLVGIVLLSLEVSLSAVLPRTSSACRSVRRSR